MRGVVKWYMNTDDTSSNIQQMTITIYFDLLIRYYVQIQMKEAKRLKEFLEDYDDDRDDPKYYRSLF